MSAKTPASPPARVAILFMVMLVAAAGNTGESTAAADRHRAWPLFMNFFHFFGFNMENRKDCTCDAMPETLGCGGSGCEKSLSNSAADGLESAVAASIL